MQKVLFWSGLLVVTLLTKRFFVDHYLPTAPGNMWIWVLIAIVFCLLIGIASGLWMAFTGKHCSGSGAKLDGSGRDRTR